MSNSPDTKEKLKQKSLKNIEVSKKYMGLFKCTKRVIHVRQGKK